MRVDRIFISEDEVEELLTDLEKALLAGIIAKDKAVWHLRERLKDLQARTRRDKARPDLTEEQKEAYLKDPHPCPFCQSFDIEAGLPEVEHGSAFQKVWCLKCQRQWNDLYKLVDVEAFDRTGS
jgi:hypothetical protein